MALENKAGLIRVPGARRVIRPFGSTYSGRAVLPSVMRFGVLGPLEVRSGSGQVTIRGVKERRLLGLLLSRANSVMRRTA